MEEHQFRVYVKEEKFLGDYGNSGFIPPVVSLLTNEWQPNYEASEETRRSDRYFLSTGEMTHLTFDMAVVYHNKDGFSSVQIVLKSSHRIVTVRVRSVDDKYIAEIEQDKQS